MDGRINNHHILHVKLFAFIWIPNLLGLTCTDPVLHHNFIHDKQNIVCIKKMRVKLGGLIKYIYVYIINKVPCWCSICKSLLISMYLNWSKGGDFCKLEVICQEL